MVNSKRYDPTITRFQKHTKSFVSGKTKKGHLNKDDDERSTEDVVKEEGKLIEVDSKDLYGKTWVVDVSGKKYHCTYGDNIIYLPPYTVVGTKYRPKKECKVEISIDKKSKIYTITRILDENKQPISMMNDKVVIQTEGSSSLVVDKDTTSISGEKLAVEGDIEIDTSKDKSLPNTDKISVKDLYKRITDIESVISDKNDNSK